MPHDVDIQQIVHAIDNLKETILYCSLGLYIMLFSLIINLVIMNRSK